MFLLFIFGRYKISVPFFKNNINVVIDRGFFHGDLKVFAHFLDNVFLIKVPAHPKGMFKKDFFNFPFEFLIMFDLFRENACQILMCTCYKKNFKSEGNSYFQHFVFSYILSASVKKNLKFLSNFAASTILVIECQLLLIIAEQ